jgi:hypothetical protein
MHLKLRISPQIFEKFGKGPYGILRSLGKLIHVNLDVENLLWHSPFKVGRTSEIVRFLWQKMEGPVSCVSNV